MMVVENLSEREREMLRSKNRNERREERGEGVSIYNF
jgi:hypothetical protein